MTRTFATNGSNDLFLGADGNLVLLAGLPAVMAACASVARSQLREMVLAQQAGIPNFQTAWIGSPNLAIWKQYLRKQLENVSGVIEVVSLTASVSKGILAYSATIRTEFGEDSING